MRRWTDEQLIGAIKTSVSIRGVIILLDLIPAGGNYTQVKERIKDLDLDTAHFLGQGSNRGNRHRGGTVAKNINEILTINSRVQSFKLKRKLFKLGMKLERCEMCSWAEKSIDGRTPLELDHINGDKYDNRLVNLRVLCPNCHSLQPTHRGKNKKARVAKW